MDLHLKDKVMIITGASQGIGLAISKLVAKEGAKVMMVGRRKQGLLDAVHQIEEDGGIADHILAELTDLNACRQVIETTQKRFGQIDGLVNNAGVNDGVSLEKGDPREFIDSLRKNVVHYFALAHYAVPYLKQGKGAIVNIGSKVSLTGQGGTSGYAASKGGVNALTREWAVELLPYSIRVNTVLPAEVQTPQYDKWIHTLPNAEKRLIEITSKIPLENRFTTSEEIANTVAFLLSDRSSHTTGQLIIVDGGYIHLDRSIG